MVMRMPRRMCGKIYSSWFLVLTVIGSSLLSTGCYDRQELEQQAFVSVMGIDKAPNGLLDCTFVIAVPTNPTGAGSAKPPLAASSPITYRAHDITEAMMLANSSVERTLTLSHLTSVIFGSGVASVGLRPYLDTLARFREFRRTVYVAVAKENARDVITANEPMLEQTTIRQADGVARVGERNGLVLVCQLHHFLTSLEESHVDPVLPMYAVNQQVKEDPKGQSGISGKDTQYSAGQIQRSGGNPVEWTGAAVFRGDKMVGELDGRETIYLRMLNGNLHSTKIDFGNNITKLGTIGLSIKKERGPIYKVELTSPPKIQVTVPLEADVVAGGTSLDFNNPALRAKLEHQLNQQLAADFTGLLTKMYHEWDVDAIPLSRTIRNRFSTHQQFVKYPWESQIKNAKLEVSVDLHLRRFGLQTLPASSQRA